MMIIGVGSDIKPKVIFMQNQTRAQYESLQVLIQASEGQDTLTIWHPVRLLRWQP